MQVTRGVYACGKCGETTYGNVLEYIPNKWMYQKSKHSRRKWFSKLVRKYVGNFLDESILTSDFLMVVNIIDKHNLLKGRNISKYSYYLIRLASRKGIKLLKPPRDIKNSKTKYAYDYRLFGIVYPLLKWNKNCKCPYWIKWKNLNIMIT